MESQIRDALIEEFENDDKCEYRFYLIKCFMS